MEIKSNKTHKYFAPPFFLAENSEELQSPPNIHNFSQQLKMMEAREFHKETLGDLTFGAYTFSIFCSWPNSK